MVFYAIYPRYAQRIKYAPCTVRHTPYIPCTASKRSRKIKISKTISKLSVRAYVICTSRLIRAFWYVFSFSILGGRAPFSPDPTRVFNIRK